jgi:hypothetical protein
MTTTGNPSPHPDTAANGWIAVDLDGTLARYESRHGIAVIGKAIEPTLARVKQWLDAGIEVRIFTARASDPALLPPLQKWLAENALPPLAITNRRDQDLIQLWDDRVVQVELNSGEVLTPKQHISLSLPGWVGVELDGTLAHYETGQDKFHIGAPVAKMFKRVQQWLMLDVDVRLFTARAADTAMLPLMQAWLKEQGLEKIKMTCEKDFMMSQFWDHRGIHVVSNTGEAAARFQPGFPAQPRG